MAYKLSVAELQAVSKKSFEEVFHHKIQWKKLWICSVIYDKPAAAF